MRTIQVKEKQWHLLTLIVSHAEGDAEILLNGERIFVARHCLPQNNVFAQNGPFSIDVASPDGGLVLFGHAKALAGDFKHCHHGGRAKFVKVHRTCITAENVWTEIVPHGVWKCHHGPCSVRNSVDATACVVCKRDRKRSAVRPADDLSPGHPGLKVVTRDSFDELIIESEAHCFVMLTADWCG